MPGSERQRFCSRCQSTVHDLSAMTQRQAERLLRDSPGGLCARITRDTAGRIVYRNEQALPRAGFWASASFVSVSLLSATPALAQGVVGQASACLAVRVVDQSGAPIANATVTVQDTVVGQTDPEGRLRSSVAPGRYDISIESPGFRKHVAQKVRIACQGDAPSQLNVQLNIGEITMGGLVVSGDLRPAPTRLAAKAKKSFWRR